MQWYYKSMAQVAVITRTKDRLQFLKRAIKSVAAQTFDDYVHVIVNDGGNKAEIDTIVASQDEAVREKIKLFHRDSQSDGPDTIFNESIDRVDSEYVALHDDDDTWHQDFLKLAVAHLDSAPDLAGVVVRTDKVTEDSVGKTAKVEQYMPDMKAVSLYRQFIDNQLTPIAFLFRRKAYEAVGKFDDSLPVVGDWEFGIRLLQKYEVDFLDPGFALANYHHRKGVKDNSFVRHDHRKYVTLVANKYLRADLEKNALGAGYIMSDLRYRVDSRSEFLKKITPRFVVKAIKR